VKIILIIILAMSFLNGCATLGWKPTEDQLNQYETNLQLANFTEAGLFVVLDSLCASQLLTRPQCIAGYGADMEWDNAFALAMSAISDYRNGVGSQETMTRIVREATAAALRITKLIKDIIASKATTAPLKSKAKPAKSPPTKK